MHSSEFQRSGTYSVFWCKATGFFLRNSIYTTCFFFNFDSIYLPRKIKSRDSIYQNIPIMNNYFWNDIYIFYRFVWRLNSKYDTLKCIHGDLGKFTGYIQFVLFRSIQVSSVVWYTISIQYCMNYIENIYYKTCLKILSVGSWTLSRWQWRI